MNSLSLCLNGAKSEIQAVLFDMDGVLVDSIPLHIKSWNYVLEKNGLPLLDQSAYRMALGRTNAQMLAAFLDRYEKKLPPAAVEDIILAKEHLFRELVADAVEPIPGVVRWLDFFKTRGIRCAVASSGDMANITLILQALKIADYFAAIVSGAHLPESKPNPTIFLLAAASLGVAPEKCLVFEDAVAGIQAAKAANMTCFAVATSLSVDQLRSADLLFEDLDQVDPQSLFCC